MESGKGKHLSPVRHLLPQMTQSDCSKSRMEAQSIHNHRAEDSRTGGQRVVSLRGPTDAPWPQAFNQTSLLSTIKSAVNHPHGQGRRGGEEGGCVEARKWSSDRNRCRYNPVVPPDTSAPEHKRARVRPQSVFFLRQMSAAVMLPVTHSGYRPAAAAAAVRRQAETERRGGERGESTDGITSVPLPYEQGTAEQSRAELRAAASTNTTQWRRNTQSPSNVCNDFLFLFFYTDGGTCRHSAFPSEGPGSLRGPYRGDPGVPL